MQRLGLVGMIVLMAGGAVRGDQGPPAPARPAALVRPSDLTMDLDGPVRSYLDRVTASWLLPAPSANPALLAMFRDRDRPPYRDLLPWSGEFAGKYLTGATEVLRVQESEALERHLRDFVAGLVALQDADGYLGPFPREHRLTGQAPNVGEKGGPTWDAWGHYHAILGLLLWHEHTGDAAALRAAMRIGDLLCDRFLGASTPRLVDTGSTEMNLAPAHGLCLLYRRTGEPRYLALARQIVDAEFAATDPEGRPLAGDYLNRGLAGEPFYRTPKPRWESLHPILALAELAQITGEPRYATAFENLWWSIVETDRHNTGGFSSGEQAQGNPYHPGAIETCCTIAWMAMTVEMLRLTGDPIAADELELSTFNTALGQVHPSGRWSTYNTPMDGQRRANFHEISFQCRPGSPELNCCSVNAARGLGLLGDWALLREDAGLLLNWYGPGTLRASLADGTPVALHIETAYPREASVRVRVEPEQATRFSLGLRVPSWSIDTAVLVDGQPVADVAPGRYLRLDRRWGPGDRIEITLDFRPRLWAGERECAGRAAVYRGPILLACDARDQAGRGDADDPEIHTSGLTSWTARATDGTRPIVLMEARDAQGRAVLLRDFATAGADGTAYRTWLRVHGAEPTAFDRAQPGRTRPVTPASP